VALRNCHPWTAGPFSFMHNGGVSSFHIVGAAMHERMGAHFASLIRGDTDSECSFFLTLFFLLDALELPLATPQDVIAAILSERAAAATSRQLAKALSKTINFVVAQNHMLAITKQRSRWASCLNFCFSNGRALVCCRFNDHTDEEPPSVYCAHGVFQYAADGSVNGALVNIVSSVLHNSSETILNLLASVSFSHHFVSGSLALACSLSLILFSM
jgi:predicted glutamine amidotransferase